jgi:hypothetical protein
MLATFNPAPDDPVSSKWHFGVLLGRAIALCDAGTSAEVGAFVALALQTVSQAPIDVVEGACPEVSNNLLLQGRSGPLLC